MKNLKFILFTFLAFLTVGVINVKADTAELTTNAGGLEDIIYNASGHDRDAVSLSGNTVKLLKDVTVTDTITFKLYSEVVFDLNGHKLYMNQGGKDLINIISGSKKLTIKSGVNDKGVLENNQDDVVVVNTETSGTALELDNVKIVVKSGLKTGLGIYDSVAIVKNTKIEYALDVNMITGIRVDDGAKLKLEDSEIESANADVVGLEINEGSATLDGDNSILFYGTSARPIILINDKSKLVVEDGTYESHNTVIDYEKGDVTINGGTFETDSTSSIIGAINYKSQENTTSVNKFVINGGIISGGSNGIYSKSAGSYGTLKITGGEISGALNYGLHLSDYSNVTLNGGYYKGGTCGIIKDSDAGMNIVINKGLFRANTSTAGGICSSVTKNPLSMVSPTSRYDQSGLDDNGTITFTEQMVNVAPNITLESYTDEFTYNKNAQGPSIVLKDAIGYTLKEGADNDYKITGSKTATNVGGYDITITFVGVYAQYEPKVIHYDIKPATITTSIEEDHYVYNGRVESPLVEVTALGDTLANVNSDFSDDNVEISYPEGRKNAGTYKVIIVGKGNYTGNKTYNIVIDRAPITASIAQKEFTYDGKVKSPSILVKANTGILSNTNKNVNTEDVKVAYQSGRTKVGTYAVTVEGIGNYIGTKTLYFVINPMKTSVKKIKINKRKATVYVNKRTKEVTGYQALYSTTKNFKNAKLKTVNKTSNVSLTIKKLKYNTKYYVKVRTFKVVNGKTYYSSWSKVKTFKTPKKK